MRVAGALFGLGWGANQFASMVLVLRWEDHLPDTVSTAMVAAYACGLLPALLVAAWISAHVGSRPVMRPMVIVGIVASAVMIAGAEHAGLLFVGRVLAGVAIGGAMGPGSAWVKELSADQPPGTGARRSAIALTGGFACGPLAAAALAQIHPSSQVVPYAVHLVVMSLLAVGVWNVAEVRSAERSTPTVEEVLRNLRSPWLVRLVLPTAVWVFTVTNVSFISLPVFLSTGLGSRAALVAGVAAFCTMGTGVAIQPVVARWERRHPGVALPVGMGLAALGLAVGAVAAAVGSLWFLVVTAPVLGASYGCTVVAGLQLVERHVAGWLLAPMNAIYYCLAYLGFFAPFVVAVVSEVLSPAMTLAIGSGMAVVSLLVVARRSLAEGRGAR